MDVVVNIDDKYYNDLMEKLDELRDENKLEDCSVMSSEAFVISPWYFEKVLQDVEEKLKDEEYSSILNDFTAEEIAHDLIEAVDNELNNSGHIDVDGMTPYDDMLDDRMYHFQKVEEVFDEAKQVMDTKNLSPLQQREILDRLKKAEKGRVPSPAYVGEDAAAYTMIALHSVVYIMRETFGAAQQNQLAEKFHYEKDDMALDEKLNFFQYMNKDYQREMRELADVVTALEPAGYKSVDEAIAKGVNELYDNTKEPNPITAAKEYMKDLSVLSTENTGAFLRGLYEATQKFSSQVPASFRENDGFADLSSMEHIFKMAKLNLRGFKELAAEADMMFAKETKTAQAQV